MGRRRIAVWVLRGGLLVTATSCATAEELGELPTGDAGLTSFGSGGMSATGGAPPQGAGGFVAPVAGGAPASQAGGAASGGAAPCSLCTAPLNGTVVCSSGNCDFACNTGFVKSGSICSRVVTCTDGMANGTETDVDCGGALCPKCAPGLLCDTDGDCARGPCEASGQCGCTPESCESALSCAAAFDDGCGGTLDCSASCVGPAICYDDRCCTAAAACSATTCSPTFDDGCGGTLDCVDNCPATDVCVAESCCTPRSCDQATCGRTTDGCGTELACPPCADGGPCASADDCESAICEAGKCVSCADGTMNNGESDIDCGGATCPKCASRKKCRDDADCESGTCCAAFGPFACILQPANTCQ